MRIKTTVATVFLSIAISACGEREPAVEAADTVFINGVIYTADAARSTAGALAVSGERIVYVGDAAAARAFIGEDTEVVDLEGGTVLPGLHDMHIHPMGIVDIGSCDMESEPMNLEEIAKLVRICIAERDLPAGEWLAVDQWNYAIGNQPAAGFTTLRQALDAGAPENPVILWGNDGHHAAVNSVALARAVNKQGVVVGLDANTLGEHFSEYRETIGVDAAGEPNGELNETARDLVSPPPRRLFDGLPLADMKRVARKLAENGITTIQDAAAPPPSLEAYRALQDSGEMTFNLSAALFLDRRNFEAAGGIDVAAMVKEATSRREAFADAPRMKVDTAKIFVDGVIEGNPLNDPPTLPNAAVLSPYKQPRFDIDLDAGHAEITGYVDTDSEVCQKVRDDWDRFTAPAAAESFRAESGFYPQQCRISRGVLEHPADFVTAYVKGLDAAGIKVHAHVIGDRAARTALDAFEAARAANGDTGLRHSLAHIQLVAPEDYKRIGDLGLYLVFTYAWALPDFYYDLTVLPFIDEVQGVENLYRPDGYYMANVYPAAQLKALGAVLAAGSDAPVDTREPRPFVNMALAVTRATDESGTPADRVGRVLNRAGRIDIRDALDAYTINGARLFGHEERTGSLEVGKYADLVVVDRDLLALAEAGDAGAIGETRVLRTVFRGSEIYRAP